MARPSKVTDRAAYTLQEIADWQLKKAGLRRCNPPAPATGFRLETFPN